MLFRPATLLMIFNKCNNRADAHFADRLIFFNCDTVTSATAKRLQEYAFPSFELQTLFIKPQTTIYFCVIMYFGVGMCSTLNSTRRR
jgi:hypothetical protein